MLKCPIIPNYADMMNCTNILKYSDMLNYDNVQNLMLNNVIISIYLMYTIFSKMNIKMYINNRDYFYL